MLKYVDPRNWNYKESPLRVTPKHIADHDARILKLKNEQKLLSRRLSKGVYKSSNDLNEAWQAQNRSFQRILDHRDAWDETTSTHPRVNEERARESGRFIGNAIQIQHQYDNIINEYAKKKGICRYLLEEDCTQGKDCYWFGKKNVDGKDVGCYSRKEPRKNWSIPLPTKRSTVPTLDTLEENPAAASEQTWPQKQEDEESKMLGGSRGSRREGGRKRRTKKRKTRKRKRRQKKTRKKKRRRKRRKN